MDVCGMFSTDTVYNSMRSSYFRDYEQFPYGTLESYKNPIQKDPYSKVQEKCQQLKMQKSNTNCPFCKEHKKRPLISYLRKREIRKKNDSICEEAEEAGEQEEEHDDKHDCH